MTPNMDEQLQSLQQRKEKLLKQEKELRQKIKARDRRERSRYLRDIGEVFEQYFEIETRNEAERIARQLQEQVKADKAHSS